MGSFIANCTNFRNLSESPEESPMGGCLKRRCPSQASTNVAKVSADRRTAFVFFFVFVLYIYDADGEKRGQEREGFLKCWKSLM